MFNGTEKRYNQYSRYLENTFGCKVYKVTLDAGFSCPNRDGLISTGGCIFCDETGSFSNAHSNRLSVREQLRVGISNIPKRFKAEKFISYFQAYTNTYADVDTLRFIYEQALFHPDVVGMSIGTRPDCVDEEKIDMISSFAQDKLVWIEYGLQSAHDKTLSLINRGHGVKEFIEAVNLTKNRNIKICTHVIVGLPGETKKDVLETAKLLADLRVDGVKIHLMCVLKNTKLEKMYANNEFTLLPPEEYVEAVCDFLEILPPEITVHRLAGNGSQELLIAPKWLGEKFKTLNMIDSELERRNSFQGKLYCKTDV